MKQTIFDSAKSILEGAPPSDALKDLTTLMLSMKYSYAEINGVRDDIKKTRGETATALLGIATTIVSNTSLFNAFVSEFKKNLKIDEDVSIDESVATNIKTFQSLVRDIVKNGEINKGLIIYGDLEYDSSDDGNNKTITKKKDGKVEWSATVNFGKQSLKLTGITSSEFDNALSESVQLSHTALHDDDAEIEKFIKKTTGVSVSFDDGDLTDDKDGDVILKNALNGRNTVATLVKAVNSYKKDESVTETLSEENLTKLTNDINSLKRIGWKLDKISKFIITKDYGIKLTADMIANIHSPVKVKAPKEPKPKKVLWPKDPPQSKINDPSHAEGYLNQAIDSEESPDIEGTEAYTILHTAGYTDHAIKSVLKNMGWEAEYQKMTNTVPRFAKKTAKKRM